MRAVACAICAVAISGCLIVRADEYRVDDPCPTTPPTLLANASGPLAIGDAVYFVSVGGMLSRVPLTGGAPSELVAERMLVNALAVDATDLYVATNDGAVLRRPLDGGEPEVVATGFYGISAMVTDDTSVVWVDPDGIDRWSKADQTIEHLADSKIIRGLGASDGRYYYTDIDSSRVRRTPPIEDLATALYGGPLVVDARGVYYAEADGSDDLDHAVTIHFIPREGGTPITTADELPPVLDLAADEDNLYFITSGYSSSYRVRQVSRFGGTVRTLACGDDTQGIYHLVIADGFVYWTDRYGLYRTARAEPSAL